MTTISIGLDGTNWDLIGDWVKSGELPVLQQLSDGGVKGVSRSCLPPLTVPNWKCFSTGKNPGKLGVFRFDRIDTDDHAHMFHDATDFRSAELWDYLNDAGYSAGVVNKPSTYPPKDIDGFVVAGGPDASENEYRKLRQGFASPSEIESFLTEELDYRVHPSPMISPTETGEAEVSAILDLIDMRFEAAERLLERENPAYLHLTVFYNMALQHYFWRDEPVFRAWQRIDDNLERFLDADHDLMLFSDHGTCRVDTVFYVNVWLAKHGYLTVEPTVDEWLRRAGLTRERSLAVAKRLGLVEILSEMVPDRIQKAVPWEEGIKRERVLSALNWEETRAVGSNQGPIYLTHDESSEAYETLRDDLIDGLESLVHPESGTRIVEAVHRGEEYYEGPYAEEAPPLLIEQGPNVHTSDAIGPDSWYSAEGVWKGGNTQEGFFLCHGPSFETRADILEVDIVDFAPTLLHLMGTAVPSDVDGTVLNVFAEGSEPAERTVETRDPLSADRDAPAGDRDDIEQRLVDLGYLE